MKLVNLCKPKDGSLGKYFNVLPVLCFQWSYKTRIHVSFAWLNMCWVIYEKYNCTRIVDAFTKICDRCGARNGENCKIN